MSHFINTDFLESSLKAHKVLFPGFLHLCTFNPAEHLNVPDGEITSAVLGWVKEKLEEGRDVFYTVQSMDPSKDPTNTRTKIMVDRIRAIFVEDDKTGYKREPSDFPIPYNLVITSSENKYHYYWLTNKEVDDFKTVEYEFKGIGNRLINQYNHDERTNDLSRVLRLAGTYNFKPKYPEPFPVEVEILSDVPYSWVELLAAFPPMSDVDLQISDSPIKGGKSMLEHNEDILTGAHLHSPTIVHLQTLKDGVPPWYVRTNFLSLLKASEAKNPQHPRHEEWKGLLEKDFDRQLNSGIEFAQKINAIKNNQITRLTDFTYRHPALPVEMFAPDDDFGDLVRGIRAMEFEPNYASAFIGVISALATLAGGKYSGPHPKDRINLVLVGVGFTGNGKQAIMDGPERVFNLVHAPDMLRHTVTKIGSPEGVEDRLLRLQDTPDLLWRCDEFGKLLQSVSNNTKSNKEGILGLILDYYTMSHSVQAIRLLKQAGRPKDDGSAPLDSLPTIVAPHLNVTGTAQQHTFTSGIDEDFILDGNGSRIQTIPLDPYKEPICRRPKGSLDISAELEDKLYDMYSHEWRSTDVSNTELLRTTHAVTVDMPDFIVDTWFDHQHELKLKATTRIEEAMYARVVLNTKKFAMIRAILANPMKPVVTEEIGRWALQLVEYFLSYQIAVYSAEVGESEEDKAYKYTIMKLDEARKDGKPYVPVNDFLDSSVFKKLKTRDKGKRLLRSMADDGLIHNEKVKTTKNPRGVQTVWLV